MAKKSKLEYIWLDGTRPTQVLRSKTKIVKDFGGTLEECPVWCFDGSSTNQRRAVLPTVCCSLWQFSLIRVVWMHFW